MNIRPDEVNRITIDRFTSASGAYVSLLCTRFERGYNVLHIVVLDAATRRVRKIVALDRHQGVAWKQWEQWRQQFAYKRDGTTYETDAPQDLSEIHWSPPILIKGDLEVLKMRPTNSSIYVRDITPVDEVTARAEAAGIRAVVADENKPKPTMGIIIKMGPDPFLYEQGYNVGDIVMFSRFVGGEFTESGHTYRYVQPQNIIGYRKPEDGLEDILPPNLPQEMIDWANQLLPTLVQIAEAKPIEVNTTRTLYPGQMVQLSEDQIAQLNHNGHLGGARE